MNKQLWHIFVLLLFRIDWRKLLLFSSFSTVVSIFVLISRLPHPLDGWIFTQTVVTNSKPVYKAIRESHTLEPVHLFKDVQRDSLFKVNQSVHGMDERDEAFSRRRQRKRRRHRKDVKLPYLTISPPPPPLYANWSKDLLKHIWSMTPHDALVYARREIENAPLVHDDPDLHAPLFHNVSTFKRSYELMEVILKVYIYSEGEQPIFHQPLLQGIYSSEGWFMKLLEDNKHFVTKDPERAHLFYLPYSMKQLQTALYVPDSHNLRPLSIFLRDYVNMLSSKYPFWNRSHGSDHFLVACHDWGPYTLVAHEELQRNTIKALCNADVSEKVFVRGKDVSLPETTIRNPSKPLRNMGGKRVSQRPILAFFAGNMHGTVRPKLIKHWRDKDEDMRIYRRIPKRILEVMSYPDHMKSSKYCICPKGFEVNSPRIVEAIYYECVPVIISDNFVPPLNEVLDWSGFSVIVAEEDIPRLKEILLGIPMRKYLAMQSNVKKLQRHFHWHNKPIRYDLFHMILHSIWSSRLNQIRGVNEPSRTEY